MAAHKMRPGLSCVTLGFCWVMLLLCIGMDVVICTVGDYCSATEDCNIPSEVCIDYVCACNSGYDELQINNTCQKSDSAPLLFCVDYLKVRINSSQGITVDPAKYVTVAGGAVTLNPNTLIVNENTLSRPQTVEAIAVSPNGLVSSCKFKIYTIAWTCLPKSFPDLPNAVESCTSNEQKLMCTVTCSSGHVHRNGYASKIYQCTGNNTWSPALPPEQCRGYSQPTYSFTVTPTYAVANVPASLCSSDHESKIRNSLSTFSARASVCSDTGGNINFNYKSKLVKVTSILTTFNVVFDSKNLTGLHMINCYNIIKAKIQDGSINLLYSGTLNCGSSFPSVSVSLNAGNTIVTTGTGVCPFNTNTLFTSFGVDICLKCSPGEFWNESACFTCPDGLFNPVSSDNNSCISCGTNMIPSADKAFCIDLCKDGFYSKDGMDPCKACPRDTYWFNATTCKPCDEGTSTFGSQGATSALQCNVPAIPENLMVFHVGSRELSLSWTTPNVVNGNVKGYRILVFKELSCFTEIYLEILGGLNISHMNCLYHETHATGSSSIFSYHLTNLKPFTNYTIQVVAVSTFVGFPASVYISTKQEVPQTPSNLTVITRGRTSAAVKWSISGDRPGITTFYFDLVAYTPAENKSASVNGFYKRTFNLIGLQENWVYTLSVLAGTPNGNSSWSFPVYLKTLPAPPGQVESLNLTRPDGTYFNQVKVQWTPPSILEQNSDITGYVLTHNTSGIEVTIYLIANNTSDKAGYMYILNVKPETIYVIKVYAIGNANLNGLERNQSYNAPPGAPPKPQVPVMPHSSSTGEAKETSKINIKIDTYFFTNGINGVIRDFGLLVCKDTCPRSVDRSHFKKENFSDINQVPSWKQAKINGLKFYRATWNKFIDLIRGSDPTRKKRSVTVSYVIGQDGSCVTQDVYCDGELDAGSSYILDRGSL